MQHKTSNDYLNEVFAGTQQVQADLSRSSQALTVERHSSSGGNGAKITGWGPWRSVVVPPNAFVVHTRRGHDQPLHCGMGISFRYNPYRDSFLIAPAVMQTIIVNARCISAERQGVMVQAYVQWIIDDFSKAYRKLDLSDQSDPMKVTNLQLQQQAEATIKDTVTTMTIDEILSDKQPIIEVLTARLRAVAEGSDLTDEEAGLGLRIVTVQIKEAIVSSTSLWENLQSAFRAERQKEAQLSKIKADLIVKEEQSAATQKINQSKLEREELLAQLEHEREARAFDLEQRELARRAEVEAARATESLEHERAIAEQRAELEKLKIGQSHMLRQLEFEREMLESARRLELLANEQELERQTSPTQLKLRLIEQLPQIISELPKPDQLRVYGDSGSGSQLNALVTELMELLGRIGLQE